MQRLIMTSATYRQSSQSSGRAGQLDPDNALLSRTPLRRMDAEVLLDTLAFVAGRLDETPFGLPAPVLMHDDGSVTLIEGKNGYRRAVYTLQRRKEIPTILANFDLPQMNPSCLERPESTVAPQALFLMNNDFVRNLANALGEGLSKESGPDPARQIEQLYWLTLSRPPKDDERATTLRKECVLEGLLDGEAKGPAPLRLGELFRIRLKTSHVAPSCFSMRPRRKGNQCPSVLDRAFWY
jgi:hypothetical protein